MQTCIDEIKRIEAEAAGRDSNETVPLPLPFPPQRRSSLCRTCVYQLSSGFFRPLSPSVPSTLPPSSPSSLSFSPHLPTEIMGESFRSIFQAKQVLHKDWTSRIYPTSTLSCLTVRGAALFTICSSTSPSVSVDVLSCFLVTVFSSSLISSSRSNFSASCIIFAGTDCLHFYKEKRHILLNVCFA